MADYILMVQLEFAPEHADELNRLYDVEHVPNLLSVDGVVALSRPAQLPRQAPPQNRTCGTTASGSR